MSDLILFPGASAATILGKGFLAVRKAGHLCVATESQSYSDYTGREKTMEVRVDVLKPGQSIHIIFFSIIHYLHYVTHFWSTKMQIIRGLIQRRCFFKRNIHFVLYWHN